MATPDAAQPQVIDTRHGKFLICNPLETVQAALLRDGGFEHHSIMLTLEVLRVKPGDIIDVGAHIGTFSVPIGNACRERKVHSFEPQRNVFSHFCANLVVNRLLNVRACNLAVGVAAPNETILVPDFNIFEERYTGSVTLDPDVVARRSEIRGVAEPATWAREFSSVRIVQLDDFVPPDPIAFIKVDVEGMELSVLRSAEKILERDRPALYFEAWDLPPFAQSNEQLMQFVRGRDYQIWRVGDDCLAIHRQDSRAIGHIHALTAERVENGSSRPVRPQGASA